MPASPPVILYRYDASPYSHRVDNTLLLKGIPHFQVDVSPTLPRPEITDVLGITYRRIPILAIGNDIYCDTSLIVSALERLFPTSAGYPTLYPRRKDGGNPDTGLVKAFSKYYVDELFGIGASLLPWTKFPAAFVEDRKSFMSAPLDVKVMEANRPRNMSKFAAHLVLVEEQLRDGREWLFDTESPGLADLTVHFYLAWVSKFPGVKSIYDTAPVACQWLSRLSAWIEKKKNGQAAPRKLQGRDAGDLIATSSHEPLSAAGFNTMEADRLGLKENDIVTVAPEDTARNFPTSGKLVALNVEEVIIQVQGQIGIFHVHFPRLGFDIRPAGKASL
ncbi:hypothetical protein AGABI1DRAFT_113516 [Agaricus bisporus var. burnettii JB137-S8]|uniref:GST N-terminal domain-containing protein n=2 Tax=Agaricus bisporus var. burnettii TaxID=192524 RepID=K5XAN4_AGABU|nr:uncharacterized protein AGABI1DRAFT_113516 [Agaricus bisporus var. burnettii JB137-S8]EKM80318.1 hypothetical protein AGABI1DRAFT_113516 [Agaricus bisporus var. burnettii JB137-S8]KAF7776189.1 hypothetical protein Agabi119p4_4582 [Agaricus bisporus var. burnettii]